ncbi:unnamed protein product [Cercospora beticola]|nr:unnamed protein product [Cercospora beticola]
MLIFSPNISLAKEFKTNISKHLEISDLGPIKYYLGIEVSRDRPNKVITLSQKGYLLKILEKYNKKGLRPVSTPIEQSVRLEKARTQASIGEIKEF